MLCQSLEHLSQTHCLWLSRGRGRKGRSREGGLLEVVAQARERRKVARARERGKVVGGGFCLRLLCGGGREVFLMGFWFWGGGWCFSWVSGLGVHGAAFNFFFFFFFEDLVFFFFKLKNYYFATWHTFGSHVAHIWQPRGTNVAATSALNGLMDGKCDGCIVLK